MKLFMGIAVVVAAVALGVWWWRRSYVPSPIEQHMNDLKARAQVGNTAQHIAYLAQPMCAMVGTGWGTTMVINPSNPYSPQNQPGTLQLGMRFAQPGGF
jgi:hypothetical protein